MKLGIITFGRALDLLVWCNGFQIIQPVWHVDTASAATEVLGAAGLFVHTQVIISNLSCRSCTYTSRSFEMYLK